MALRRSRSPGWAHVASVGGRSYLSGSPELHLALNDELSIAGTGMGGRGYGGEMGGGSCGYTRRPSGARVRGGGAPVGGACACD